MREVPSHWIRSTLAEVADWGSGGTPTAGRVDYYDGDIPWAMIGDLNDGVVTETQRRITDLGLRSSSAKLVPADAVLLAMYGSIGKLGLTARPMATNQAIAFAQCGPHILPKFLFYFLLSQRAELTGAGKGAAQKNISQSVLRPWPVAYPSIEEQRCIVDLLEDHLSRLDAADAYVSAGSSRTRSLTRSILESIIPMDGRDGWRMTTVGRAGRLQLGRARHPDWHNGPEMRPYLRVANVFEDRIVTDDVMSMDFSGVFEKYRLHPGDVLLNEGQSPHLLGRPAMYRGEPAEVAFTNSLIRFQAADDVLPEWALLVFRRHMHSGRFRRESRITTNIAHLSMARLKDVEFPIPPLSEQASRVEHAREALGAVTRLGKDAVRAKKRAAGLRRALLEAAFSGRLTGRSSDLELVDEMAGAAS